ncbi:MAG: BrnA antitoxin family protein [Burkholderiales bacterium]
MSKRKPLTNREGEVRELTAQDFRRMRPAREVLPKMIGAKAAAELLRPRGRPPKENPKAQVTLRLDAEVLKHFKAGGPGWQTRINAALKRAAAKAR